jgi:hypothetical protein
MASTGEEFILFHRVLYLWTVYTSSLIYVHMCLFTVFYSLKRMCSGSCYTKIYFQNNIKIILLLAQYFFTHYAEDAVFGYMGYFFSCLTDNPRPNATSDTLPTLHRTSRVGEFQHSLTEARQTITLRVTFRKSNQNSLQFRAIANRSNRKNTLYFQVH